MIVDYQILGKLRITPPNISNFPLEDFRNILERKFLMEVDPFTSTPLFTRKSTSRHLLFDSDLDDEKIWHDLYVVTIVMIELLKEEKQQGEVVLYYKSITQGFDFEIVCSAFKANDSPHLVNAKELEDRCPAVSSMVNPPVRCTLTIGHSSQHFGTDDSYFSNVND